MRLSKVDRSFQSEMERNGNSRKTNTSFSAGYCTSGKKWYIILIRRCPSRRTGVPHTLQYTIEWHGMQEPEVNILDLLGMNGSFLLLLPETGIKQRDLTEWRI